MPRPNHRRSRLGFAFIWVPILATLGACSTAIPKDPTSPYYQVPPGSTLRLEQKIAIPPGRARVFIQHGTVTGDTFDHYAPNCNVEVDRLDEDQAQYVAPGDYRIDRVQQTQEQVVQARRVQVAALGHAPLLLADSVDSDGQSDIYLGYHLWLEDPADNFMRLSCRGALDEPADARPPSIDDMRRTLGGLAQLLLADD